MSKSKPAAQASGYLVASAVALAVDILVTLALGRWYAPVTAGAIGFAVGAFVSYGLAKKLAFIGPKNHQEFIGYFAVGLITLWQTTGIIYLLTAYAGWSLVFAKCAAIPVSFVVGFFMRAKLAARVALKAVA